MRAYICGVPNAQCNGASRIVAGGDATKVHQTTEEAFKCYKSWLLRQGYKQLGPREFQLNNDPILVLTKKVRFGIPLRGGKKGEGNKGKRYNFRQRTGGGIG